MLLSEAWLREWVNPAVSIQELTDALSMAGLEVDGYEPAAGEFSGIVVGYVQSCARHPDADKLSVCQVDAGTGETLQIVCGANNIGADMKVPVALVGAVLPGDFKIRKAKLRGVESCGMICSAAEMGLTESSDGIMVLPKDASIGADIREYLSLDDYIIDIDLTPDRGDCLSVAGIARDVSVIYREPLTQWELQPPSAVLQDIMPVKLEAPELCPAYSCRIMRGIDPNAQTPLWMQEKLRRSGIRSISPVVDVTNYVMIELGQPMHAFDLHTISGQVHVRLSPGGEKFVLLDGSECETQAGTLLIADDAKPLALAGIMGGASSSVTENTQDILLESAFFVPTAIIGKARQYGLHTDSSHRFERGVDPALHNYAMERATELLQSIVGGEVSLVNQAIDHEHYPKPATVILRRAQVERILGVSIEDSVIEDILQRLGMQITANGQGWDVIAPSARFDISIEVDLIEEIGRIYGYANIPENFSAAPVRIQAKPESSFHLDKARQLLADRDYQEVITYSFISPEQAALLTPEATPIRLANPISADMSVMRASLWPGLLATLKYNLARQQDRVRLFELGQVFHQAQDDIQQPAMLGGLIYGDAIPEQWCANPRKADYYDLKGDLEALLSLVGDTHDFIFEPTQQSSLHPGQSAQIVRQGQVIGYLGLLHPAIQAKLDIPRNVFLFELSIQALENGRIPAFSPVSKYPSIRRDLAILVDEAVSWASVENCVRKAAPEILRDIRLFDVYTGDNIEEGRKSLALSLILQDYSNTLTDEEIDSAVSLVLQALESELAAKLRD